MKKFLIAAGLVLAMTGLATAQTTPATTQKKAKTEKTAKHSHHKKHQMAAKPAGK